MTGRPATKPPLSHFARCLRDAQAEAEMSNRELAHDADISESLLGKYRRGESTPGLEIASRLARALGKSLDYFAPDEELAA